MPASRSAMRPCMGVATILALASALLAPSVPAGADDPPAAPAPAVEPVPPAGLAAPEAVVAAVAPTAVPSAEAEAAAQARRHEQKEKREERRRRAAIIAPVALLHLGIGTWLFILARRERAWPYLWAFLSLPFGVFAALLFFLSRIHAALARRPDPTGAAA